MVYVVMWLGLFGGKWKWKKVNDWVSIVYVDV